MNETLSDQERIQKDCDYQKKLNASLNEAIIALENENQRLTQLNAILETEKRQWEVSKVQQQQIIQQSLNASNETNNRYLEENQSLQAEVRSLKKQIDSFQKE